MILILREYFALCILPDNFQKKMQNLKLSYSAIAYIRFLPSSGLLYGFMQMRFKFDSNLKA